MEVLTPLSPVEDWYVSTIEVLHILKRHEIVGKITSPDDEAATTVHKIHSEIKEDCRLFAIEKIKQSTEFRERCTLWLSAVEEYMFIKGYVTKRFYDLEESGFVIQCPSGIVEE